jgi:hypothetical protein
MILWSVAALLWLAGGSAGGEDPPRPMQLAQLVVREQIVVRISPMRPAAPAQSNVAWKEGKKVRCVAARSLAGATLVSRDSVDFIMRDNSRVRARLAKSCPALDYYSGFYITPNEDGMVCADRDSVRSRMGGECEIERFRTLTAIVQD